MSAPELKHVLTGPIGDSDPEFLSEMPKDNLVAGIMALSGEVYILRERLRTLERALERSGTLGSDDVEHLTPTDEERELDQADLTAFVSRIMSEITRQAVPASNVNPRAKDRVGQPE